MHEQSETVERDDKFYNVYGRKTPNAGKDLPGEPAYNTLEEAVAGAKRRSMSFDDEPAFDVKVTPRGRPSEPKDEPKDDKTEKKPVTDEKLLKKLEGDDRGSRKPVTDPDTLKALEAAPADNTGAIVARQAGALGRKAAARGAEVLKQMDPDVDYSGVKSTGLRAEYGFLDTPEEREGFLKGHFGAKNVTKDSFGRDVVLINGQKVAFLPRGNKDEGKEGGAAASWGDVASEVLPVAGMTAGGIIGAPITLGPVPVGAIAGAGAGASGGRALNKLIKQLFLGNTQSSEETAKDIVLEAPKGMAAQTVGEVMGLLGRSALRGPFREGSVFGPLTEKSKEVFREGQAAVAEARELGLKPKVGTYSPNASFTQRVQNAGFRLFGDDLTLKNRPILEREGGKLTGGRLSNTPAETERLSLAVSQRADALVKTAETAANQAQAEAEGLLKAAEAEITAARGPTSTNLGAQTSKDIFELKENFTERASGIYGPVDALAGKPVVPSARLTNTMKTILDEMPKTADGKPVFIPAELRTFSKEIAELPQYVTFQQMQVIRSTLRDSSSVKALNAGLSDRQAARLAQAADTAFNDAKDSLFTERTIPAVEKPESFKGTSLLQKIKEMGGIDPSYAADITGESKMGTKGVPPGLFSTGSWKGGRGTGLDDLATRLNAEGWDVNPSDTNDLLSKIQDEVAGRRKYYSLADEERLSQTSVDREFYEEMKAAGQAGEQKVVEKAPLPGVEEAKRALRRADKFYAAGMKRFHDLGVEAMVKDATRSGYVEPEKVAERIAQPDMVSKLLRIKKVVSPETFGQIGSARWSGLLRDAKDPLTGNVSGKRLASSLKKMGNVLDELYGEGEAGRMRAYAEHLAALDGDIPAESLKSGKLSQVVQDAVFKKEALNETMKRGYIKALQSNGPESLKAARWLTEPDNRLSLRQTMGAFGPQSQESKAIREYLARRIFSSMEVQATKGAEKYGTTELMGEPLQKELERYGRPYLEEVFGKPWTDSAYKFARQAEVATRKNPVDSGGLLAATLGLHWMRHLGEIARYFTAGELLSTDPVITYLSRGIEFQGADFLQKWVGRGMQLGINIEAEKLPKKTEDRARGYVTHARGAFGNMLQSTQPIEGRQQGGPVDAGTPYVVGESGPEVIVPEQSGSVVPNHGDDPALISWLRRLLFSAPMKPEGEPLSLRMADTLAQDPLRLKMDQGRDFLKIDPNVNVLGMEFRLPTVPADWPQRKPMPGE